MSPAIRMTGNPTGLRYAAYFVFFVAIIFGAATLNLCHHEYLAQRWPVASGEILSAEEQSRSEGRSTLYWIRYTVLLDVPEEQCRPREPWIFVGNIRPARCWARFNTLEDSRATAYRWTKRHATRSRAQFHYEPLGYGVRFAGESFADIYPWKKIFITLAMIAAGFGLLQLSRRVQENQNDADPARAGNPATSSGTIPADQDQDDPNALLDLKLR